MSPLQCALLILALLKYFSFASNCAAPGSDVDESDLITLREVRSVKGSDHESDSVETSSDSDVDEKDSLWREVRSVKGSDHENDSEETSSDSDVDERDLITWREAPSESGSDRESDTVNGTGSSSTDSDDTKISTNRKNLILELVPVLRKDYADSEENNNKDVEPLEDHTSTPVPKNLGIDTTRYLNGSDSESGSDDEKENSKVFEDNQTDNPDTFDSNENVTFISGEDSPTNVNYSSIKPIIIPSDKSDDLSPTITSNTTDSANNIKPSDNVNNTKPIDNLAKPAENSTDKAAVPVAKTEAVNLSKTNDKKSLSSEVTSVDSSESDSTSGSVTAMSWTLIIAAVLIACGAVAIGYIKYRKNQIESADLK